MYESYAEVTNHAVGTYIAIVIIVYIIQGIIFGIATSRIINNKGYDENWFAWGFFFGIIAMLVAIGKPERRVEVTTSGPVLERKESQQKREWRNETKTLWIKKTNMNEPIFPRRIYFSISEDDTTANLQVISTKHPGAVKGVLSMIDQFGDSVLSRECVFSEFVRKTGNNFLSEAIKIEWTDRIKESEIQTFETDFCVKKYIWKDEVIPNEPLSDELVLIEENNTTIMDRIIDDAEHMSSAMEIYKYLLEYNAFLESSLYDEEMIKKIRANATIEREYGNTKNDVMVILRNYAEQVKSNENTKNYVETPIVSSEVQPLNNQRSAEVQVQQKQETNNNHGTKIEMTTQKTESKQPTLEELQILYEYKKLLDSGVINQDEFDARKKQILG
ncbi:MAG: SHOCT domain-containing protein [Eubacterium sp.]|nr:SHOCT domain-containing protein [Eubacterium sp.]